MGHLLSIVTKCFQMHLDGSSLLVIRYSKMRFGVENLRTLARIWIRCEPVPLLLIK